MESKIFDLDIIKKYFNPIEELQGKLHYLNSFFNKYIALSATFGTNIEKEEIKKSIRESSSNIKNINQKLVEIINNNLNKYIVFQDTLIKKYKDIYAKKLKQTNVDQNFIKSIGLYLIENKQISRIIGKTSYIPSIHLNNWSDLIDSLHNNSLFLSTIQKIDNFYKIIIKKKLKLKISEIPEDIDPIIINDFKKEFLNNPSLNFDVFLRNIENKLSEKEFSKRKNIFKKSREKQKIEELKKTQEEQKKSYEDYFKYSNKEFERRRRKKKREKLSEIAEKPIKEEIVDEDIAEKIKKFKSKFGNSFEEKYLIQKDDNEDPLEIIRERKKKKEEEYKKFLEKLKEEERV
ncbi:MAG: hypothetical protein KGD63_05445 [Candidatus Lokiarchaeota archaeon]|nr:hypothetical protein [Candidatus Lokiarchaeota archaeon]